MDTDSSFLLYGGSLTSTTNTLLQEPSFLSTNKRKTNEDVSGPTQKKPFSSDMFSSPLLSTDNNLLSPFWELPQTHLSDQVLQKPQSVFDQFPQKPEQKDLQMLITATAEGNEAAWREKVPYYSLKKLTDRGQLEHLKNFMLMEESERLIQKRNLEMAEEKLNSKKVVLINAVAASLISAPNFRDKDNEARHNLIVAADDVSQTDPEFILKAALYARKELNLRTTANFLLSYAAFNARCRPYLKKYFGAIVKIPADWIDVAEQYQIFEDKSINFGSLPSSLRRVMVSKFPDFDTYQLGKYKSKNTKKKKPAKQTSQNNNKEDIESEDEEEEMIVEEGERETKEERERRSFTLKQLVRCLHISRPMDHVLSLLGKRYPDNQIDFMKSGFAGIFDEKRAGKRMKLPTPETWETQVSMKGSKAKTWESLLDHNKLPFVAMFRNVRNMLLAGISESHHQKVINRLMNQTQIVNSNIQSFKYFTAFDVLDSLKEDFKLYKKGQIWFNSNRELSQMTEVARLKAKRDNIILRKMGYLFGSMFGANAKYDAFSKLLSSYRKALSTAVEVALQFNLPPIKGRTVIFCNLGPEMDVPCNATAVFSKPREIAEVAALLGLMCCYVCEDSQLILFARTHHQYKFTRGNILFSLEELLKKNEELRSSSQENSNTSGQPTVLPLDVVKQQLSFDQWVDTFILLSNESVNTDLMQDVIIPYRSNVNPNLLCVTVDLVAKTPRANPTSEHDLYLAGFSEQMLRLVAECGGKNQLLRIEGLDQKYGLKPLPKQMNTDQEAMVTLPPQLPRWRTVRIFVSSTFRDMMGERDILARYVFPELRERASSLLLRIHEVDLRWGITETEANSLLELCLNEVSRCDLFVGILGDRYGWVPQRQVLEETASRCSDLEWLLHHPADASITELEMYAAALYDPSIALNRAFFYLRDSSVSRNISDDVRQDLVEEEHEERLNQLKDKIRCSGLEVYDGYPAKCMGSAGGLPVVVDLEAFGERVLDNLWNCLQTKYQLEYSTDDTQDIEEEMHENLAEKMSSDVVGRKTLINTVVESLASHQVIVVSGSPGSGKSAVMGCVKNELRGRRLVLGFFVGSYPESSTFDGFVKYMSRQLIKSGEVVGMVLGGTTQELNMNFNVILGKAVDNKGKVTMLVDGVDAMDAKSRTDMITWITSKFPKGVNVIVSCNDHSPVYTVVSGVEGALVVPLSGMPMTDRGELVRNTLAHYRKQLEESPFNNQLRLLLTKRHAGHPLYLRLACDIIRKFGVYEEVSGKLRSLGQTVKDLLQDVLKDLEKEFGSELVAEALGTIAVARQGLTEADLYEILNMNDGRDFVAPAKFARLVRALQGFLHPLQDNSNTETMLSLVHQDMREAVNGRYLRTDADRIKYHKSLSEYFLEQFWSVAEKYTNTIPEIALTELPYHLVSCDNLETFQTILSSVRFFELKIMAGKAGELLQDYSIEGDPELSMRTKQKRLNQRNSLNQQLEPFKQFVSKNLHVFKSKRDATIQQVVQDESVLEKCIDRSYVEEAVSKLYLMVNRKSGAAPDLNVSDFDEALQCCATSKNNQVAVSGSVRTIRVFDMNSGLETRSLLGHGSQVTSVAWLSSKILLSGDADGQLCVWDVDRSIRLTVEPSAHGGRLTGIAAAPDSRSLVTVGWDAAIKVWSGEDYRELSCIRLCKQPLNCVSYHPCKAMAATAGWDHLIRLWDLIKMERRAVLRGHESSVQCLVFSPCGGSLCSSSLDGSVRVWSSARGVCVGVVDRSTSLCTSVQYSATGKELVLGHRDGKLQVWRASMGRVDRVIENKTIKDDVSVAICNEKCVIAGYRNGYISVTRLSDKTQKHICVGSSSISAMCFSYVKPDEEAFVCTDTCVMKIDIRESQKNLKVVSTQTRHTALITAVATSDKYMATASEDSNICFYSYSWDCEFEQGPWFIGQAHAGAISCLAFDSTGNCLLSGGQDQVIRVWDIPGNGDYPEVKSTFPHPGWISGLGWGTVKGSPVIASAGRDGLVRVWNANTGEIMISLAEHASAISFLNSLGDNHFVTGSTDGQVILWSSNGVPLAKQEGNFALCSRQYKSNQETVLLVCQRNVVSIIHPDKGEFVADLNGHSNSVTGISVGDGKLATVSTDRSLKLWSLPKEKSLQTPHRGKVTGIDIKGSTMATVGIDSTLRLWNVSKELPKLTRKVEMTKHGALSCVKLLEEDKIVGATMKGRVLLWTKSAQGTLMLACDKEVSRAPILSLDATSTWVAAISDGRLHMLSITKESSLKLVKSFDRNGRWAINVLLSQQHEGRRVVCWSSGGGAAAMGSGVTVDTVSGLAPSSATFSSLSSWPACLVELDGRTVLGQKNGELVMLTKDCKGILARTKAHDGGISALSIASVNPSLLLSAGEDGKICVWTPEAKNLALVSQYEHTAPITCLCTQREEFDEDKVNIWGGDEWGGCVSVLLKVPVSDE